MSGVNRYTPATASDAAPRMTQHGSYDLLTPEPPYLRLQLDLPIRFEGNERRRRLFSGAWARSWPKWTRRINTTSGSRRGLRRKHGANLRWPHTSIDRVVMGSADFGGRHTSSAMPRRHLDTPGTSEFRQITCQKRLPPQSRAPMRSSRCSPAHGPRNLLPLLRAWESPIN